MARNKQTDEEALAELAEWCRPLGLDVTAHERCVCIIWRDRAKNSVVPVTHEDRGWTSAKKRISVRTTCQKLINRVFKSGAWLYWTKDRTSSCGVYDMRTEETVCLKLPVSESPAEMELKLTANGWTGNPFENAKKR